MAKPEEWDSRTAKLISASIDTVSLTPSEMRLSVGSVSEDWVDISIYDGYWFGDFGHISLRYDTTVDNVPVNLSQCGFSTVSGITEAKIVSCIGNAKETTIRVTASRPAGPMKYDMTIKVYANGTITYTRTKVLNI